VHLTFFYVSLNSLISCRLRMTCHSFNNLSMHKIRWKWVLSGTFSKRTPFTYYLWASGFHSHYYMIENKMISTSTTRNWNAAVTYYLSILNHHVYTYRVSQEECAILREGVPYVKLYRYNPKHLYPKLNGYGDNGQRKVGTSCISA